jgi:large subunit ribosomal protein L13Ae
VVVPQALKILRLKPGRRFCSLGRLAHEVGWGHRELVTRLESKRKIKAEAFYQQKKAGIAAKALAERKAASELASVNSVLAAFGNHIEITPNADRIKPPAPKAKKAKAAAA